MRFLLLAACLLLFCGCPRSTLGERLFDITFPPVDFDIRAGQPSFRTFVIAQPGVTTGFNQALADRGLSADDVDIVSGVRARIVSLSGEDFREIERIELRVCPASATDCTYIDLLFSIDDLGGRRQQVVNLNPGERNFRNLFLQEEAVRVEIVVTPFNVTTQNIDARLEWTLGALGGLE